MLCINIFFSGSCENCFKLVVLIIVIDKDFGSNGEIEFLEICGNVSIFFEIDNSIGLIEVFINDMSLFNGIYLYIVNIIDKGILFCGIIVIFLFNVVVLMNI